ncbi:MAG: Suppressor of fused protein (SUFU) [Porphyrobacter sp. IPPAS B-1204]|nr:MAG: Suppressor of fused protein (SUFU) [Porphyrobacter sp. IPPAS B-1204]
MPSRRGLMLGAFSAWVASLVRPAKALADDSPAPGMIAIDDPRYDRFFAARTQVWESLGSVDDDVIAYIISPEFNGGPAWPTTRQAYRVVRPEGSLIIASDGLSDLFVDTNSPEPGFGCEVYLESPDLADADFDAVRRSWQFSLIESFAQNVAHFGGINERLERLGVISMELPAPLAMPQRWVTDRGTVGALINIMVPDRPTQCALEEGMNIRLVALTALLPDETEHVIAGRAAARAEVAGLLVSSGTGLTSPANRRSVLA